jgi:hypothetical protein
LLRFRCDGLRSTWPAPLLVDAIQYHPTALCDAVQTSCDGGCVSAMAAAVNESSFTGTHRGRFATQANLFSLRWPSVIRGVTAAALRAMCHSAAQWSYLFSRGE